MADNMKKKDKEKEDDSQLDFVCSYVVKTFRFKAEKWHKMMGTDELKTIVMDWVNQTNIKLLVITVNTTGVLIPSLTYPTSSRGKSCYFIRKLPVEITKDNIKDVILFGDVSSRPIEDLSVIVDEIFFPILNNPQNQVGWPSVIVEDVESHLQKLRNTIAEVKGSIMNKTILPLPMTIDDVLKNEADIVKGNFKLCDLKMKNSLEGIVIKWVSSINDILKEDSATLLITNTGPAVEIKFWNDRLNNLENIFNQLRSEKIKSVATVLETIDSVYFTSFRISFKNVVTALVKARDITLWITPLMTHVEIIESTDFLDSKSLIQPLLHCVCLVWANSRYCTNTQMVKLLKMICNLFISKSSKYLEPYSLFQGEVDDGLTKIERTISILNYFKSQYYEYRKKLSIFALPNTNPIYWTFKSPKIFKRFDHYMKRLYEIRNIFVTANDFLKLEKVEIGGLKGRNISRNIAKIYDDFLNLYSNWTSIQLDPLDPDPKLKLFEIERRKFQGKTDILERKLATLLAQSFDECGNLEQFNKLNQMAGSLLQRSIIMSDVKEKFSLVLQYFNVELDLVKSCFDKSYDEYKRRGFQSIPIDRGFPPVAGTISWLHSLQERLVRPSNDFQYLEYPIFESAEGKETLKRFDDLIKALRDFETEIYQEWIQDVQEQLTSNMNQTILARNEDKLLLLNFSEKLISLLREIKLMKLMEIKFLPEELLYIYEISEDLWKARIMISRIVEWYNFLRKNTNSCEFDIIEVQVNMIDMELIKGLNDEKWINYDQEYLSNIFGNIHNLYERVLQTQDNIKTLQKTIRNWGEQPMYERKEGRSFLNILDRISIINKRHEKCKKTADLIDKIIENNFQLFCNISLIKVPPKGILNSERFENLTVEQQSQTGVDDSKNNIDMKNEVQTSEDTFSFRRTMSFDEMLILYTAYKEYVDRLIFEEINNAVNFSLSYILTEMENHNSRPIFEVKLELQEPDIVFIPSLDSANKTGLLSLIKTLIDDIYTMSDIIPRIFQLSEDEITTYRKFIDTDPELIEIKEEIITNTRQTICLAVDYISKYEEYKNLWVDDKVKALNYFLKNGCLPIKGLNSFKNSDLIFQENQPSLVTFKEQIDYYNELYEKINKMDTNKTFNGWLLVDLKSFKQSLLNEICKWSNLFKQNLVGRVVNSLQELENFINNGTKILQRTVTKDDFAILLKVMSLLSQIRAREKLTNIMFEPLKEIVDLLKQYNVDFSSKVLAQFLDLPEKWLRLKKNAIIVRLSVAPIQKFQVDQINKKIILFDLKTKVYREKFHALPFFEVPCLYVYNLCDRVNIELNEMEKELKNLKDSASLFELIPPSHEKLHTCRKELRMIKQLWDFVTIIESSVDDWKTSPWKKIDVEDMEQECKKLAKDIRTLDKDMRLWRPYVHLEVLIKNLVTSLRAITELQNPAIKERHWIELMHTTKLTDIYGKDLLVRFNMDDSTTLAHLLDLQLHEYEDEVKNIVDKSVKEMTMEKTLNDLSITWSVMEFDYDLHPRTELKLLRATEELIETLEENQVQLQNLLGSKYIAFFLTEVTKWQSLLANADQVIGIWFEVQRKWMYLESIFIGSEDIRSQLPTDSKRFDSIDSEFKEILEKLLGSPNVVNVTNKRGLYDRLDILLRQLILCEKALNNYLETKRLAFPRFYFVSSADLLDILSNGNNPSLVCRHLTKLFDSIAKLKFASDGKNAIGMISKEHEEYVDFKDVCDCTGKVEVWLNRLTNSMRRTLHNLFESAIQSYEDKAREVWIFDWPAQTALCGTQIWWTTDVNLAFINLEEGYENALKDYNKKQISQLNALIVLLLGDLTSGDRQKIMTICTIDVHSRDVVSKMIAYKLEYGSAFQWQSQLRHRWDSLMQDCFANICDAQFRYDYEYLGNTPRLVITPLTDRCYITLTQSLHLIMGGAPAGPAGTGKTETTKDLGRALGVMVYVFNCSEQMDYKSCGNIYKGLAQTGAWGCFDEFNRISVEVLSVVAVQVKTIQDAIKGGKKYATLDDHADKTKKLKFNFMGENISLVPTVGIFITMNPGYAGRTELPENLKALFRPCAMVVPDFALICEIMLVAEGFQEARLLARKFISLYTLCKELLSKQDHYDWGLRAIKSVLVVAGSLKRGDRQRPEDQVLMRALRDFNTPKIVTDDVPVFMGLIGDLFPALDVPRKRSSDFEKLIKKSAADLKLQPEDGYVLKVVQLEELFTVRHSVFIVGNAGTGKTEIWRGLFRTYQNQKRKPYYNDLNPKAVTNDELFGIINPATREWKDGLFSAIMRDQANMAGTGPRWIVLDGDIDPMWIESLNTVMDDNKVLTLASNERISLTKEMRLLFEIGHLRTATPATVSRAGILYINPQDLGWYPFVASWVDTRESQTEKSHFMLLFDKYIPTLLEANKKFKKITPISDIAMIQMTCHLLNCLLTPQNIPPDSPKEWYEIYFSFAVIWGFGSALFQDQLIDWRSEFHKWWINEFKTVKFPLEGSVFNYYIDPINKMFTPWSNLVPGYELDCDIPLQSVIVPTVETSRIKYFLDILMERKQPVMLVGSSGSGKSVIVADKLHNMSDNYSITNVPFNFYTTSEMLQTILEKPLEKKAGRNFGPPGNKTMIFFIDDMNMPEVDEYYSVQPHTIIRQFMDYQHWYDRTKLTLKDIHSCQIVSCMNPTAGAFTIDTRLQRHFCVFAVNFPSNNSVFQIYNSILSQHLNNPHNKFSPQVQKMCSLIVNTELALHAKVVTQFLPTAVKFHYIFNLRDLANIFQGILFANNETCPEPNSLIRLWLHESTRVYGDKLVSVKDMDTFKKLVIEITKKGFEDLEESKVFSEPIIFSHFAEGLVDPKYMPVGSWIKLGELLEKAQINYNEIVGNLNLVLFEDAMSHICRVSRIIESPRGNALLIGVGGSGKQSLARLSAFISSLSVTQIQLRKAYSMLDLKNDLALLYIKVGVKNVASMFLMTDSQVAEEEFLVLINDMLASGEISELFPDDEIDNIANAVRNEVKQLGILDTKQNCWQYFIDKVRKMLKTVLCFSPVGSTLRVRARKFPAVVNCTAIDWFHEWPKKALESVSNKFLSEIPTLPSDLTKSVSSFMAYVHGTVSEMSKVYMQNEKRYNYTTPKSFLELISLYSKLLSEKTQELKDKIVRLENGILKLSECAVQVDSLQERLVQQEIELKLKNEMADKLIGVVSAENEKVQKEKNHAAEEEKKVRAIEEDVSIKAKLCEEDLRRAEPALVAAQEALNTLNKNNLTELRSFGSPPEAVVNVCAAVMVLFSPRGKLPKDRSWRASKTMMGKVDQFLYDLINYDKEHIRSHVIQALQPYLKNNEFDPSTIVGKSAAAAGLCAWVININKFYEVFLVVEPKQRALKEAKVELKSAQDRMEFLNAKINELEDKLKEIQDEFDGAIKEKQKCQSEADKTSFTIDLANRLIGGLASENVRWRDSVSNFKNHIVTLPGDVLLVSCFISYVGCFTRRYRSELLERMWMPTFENIKPYIPHTFAVDPLRLICDDALIASWNNEGLPNDRMSTENATILTNSARWPLMIDPQLQGIKWIKQKYDTKLVIIRLTMKGYIDIIEKALKNGDILLIENIGESVDAVLDPLLGRAFIRKGKALKIGEKEMDYDPRFRLILQTKLGNPHYKPEMQAQTTLINFTVTRDGLEEQLLAEVVKAERPDLEQLKTELTMQQNTFKITLKVLEDDLLRRLASAGENVLEDPTLVLNLEKTKKTAEEIEIKVKEARITSVEIDIAREQYRSAAERASILYFILNELHKINPIYQFSLKAFIVVFKSAISSAIDDEKLKVRVSKLLESITFSVFMYTCRGLFEKDKLIFMAQMVIQILLQAGEIKSVELDFLLRYPYTQNITSPFDFLSNISWGGIKSLSSMDDFRNLDKDIEASAKRWKKFLESECPEKEKFPGEWKNKTAIQRLCMMRSLRPDRMTYAIRAFVEETLGSKYVEARTIEFIKSFEEMSNTTPIFFILSPGVDPLVDVEKVGKKLKFSIDHENFYNVSLGQGQEVVAEAAMDVAAKNGHWVVLQNIHLVSNWLTTLEKKMEITIDESHINYRLFISAEPAGTPEYHIIPQGILESSIKITNEPPTGMQANLHKALDNFNQETLEMCSKEAEFKSVLFSLCYFHAVVAERRKFGPQGWNRSYPFNVGDLTISVYVLYNYLEANSKVPWEDLKYLFGEIMYGGHITDDWDRRLCRTYLEEFMQPELVDGDLNLCAGFLAPSNRDYKGYHKYVDEQLPPESPYLYGLHPNAEIGFLTTLSDQLFKTIFELQPRDSGSCSRSSISREETVKIILEDIIDKLPEEFNMPDIMSRVEERTPFIIVAFQECERMNYLVGEMRRSLKELFLGLKGELTITLGMENLEEALFFDHVPENWERLAYPSLFGLQSWFADLTVRFKELDHWSSDFSLPSSVWLGGFFNPQSFLTAIMQQTARKNEWPLDKMCLCCDVTKKQKDFFTIPPKEGAYVNGLFMEGARWDTTVGAMGNSRLKELFPMMPVIYIKAITQDKQESKNIYECPVYKTRMRGSTYVWTFNLKTKEKPSKWILGGVCLLLQV